MLIEAMEHYGLARDIRTAGYFETEHHRQIARQVRAAILAGQLIAVTGIVGCGKTVLLRRLQDDLAREGKVLVSKSLSVDKERATLPTLIAALFYDLSPDKDPRIPTQGEKRERDLRDLVKRSRKPVVLFVDEAHDLHGKTLTGLKRLMEVVADGGGMLSIVLAGHPKLRNDLRRPTMEEIGYRAAVFSFDGMAGHQHDYIAWLLGTCAADDVPIHDMIDSGAIDLLAAKLKTPLQIEQHLTLAFEEGYRVGEKPVTADVTQAVLSRHLEDLEPRLTRHGYTVRALADQFNAKPAEIKLFLHGQLDAARTRELSDQMLAAGLPI
jgi:type II secretory pathway predicted ATPase ExeA